MKVRIPSKLWGPKRDADSSDMLEYLGLDRKGHLPKEGMDVRLVCGVPVYVTPHVPEFYSTGFPRKSSKHRVFAICNCGAHVPTGRLHQHKCDPRRKLQPDEATADEVKHYLTYGDKPLAPEEQAKVDFEGGWVPPLYTDAGIASHLIVTANASEEYIAQYIAAYRKLQEA